MDEQSIRLDERIKCASEIEAFAYAYESKWSPIVGENRAKAGAWDIIVAARKLLPIEEYHRAADSASVLPGEGCGAVGHQVRGTCPRCGCSQD